MSSRKSKKKKNKKEKKKAGTSSDDDNEKLSQETEDAGKQDSTEGKHPHGQQPTSEGNHGKKKKKKKKHTHSPPSPNRGTPKKRLDFRKTACKLGQGTPSSNTKDLKSSVDAHRAYHDPGKSCRKSGSSSRSWRNSPSPGCGTRQGSSRSVQSFSVRTSAEQPVPRVSPQRSKTWRLMRGKSTPRDTQLKDAQGPSHYGSFSEERRPPKRSFDADEDVPYAKRRNAQDWTPQGSPQHSSLSEDSGVKRRLLEGSGGSGSFPETQASHQSFGFSKGIGGLACPSQEVPPDQAPKLGPQTPSQSSPVQHEKSGTVHSSVSGGKPFAYPRLPVSFKIPTKTGLHKNPFQFISREADNENVSSRRHSLCFQHPNLDRAVTQAVSTDNSEVSDNHQEMELLEELHLARTNKQLDVNVVESCGALTCMDIDLPEEGATVPASKAPLQQDLLVVLDTNILLSHLDFVKKIRAHGLGALGFPTLLIPWVVLQELDFLKDGKLSSRVEHKARPAVHYIYSCLKGQEPRLWGQSMQQASQPICGLGVQNNDDRVLQCCLQYQSLYPGVALILCTNDKNLCSKALLSGVRALSKVDLERERYRKSLPNHSTVQQRPENPCPVMPPAQKGQPIRRSAEEAEGTSAAKASELSVCMSVLESTLQGALSVVLEEEMKAAYGELWDEIVYLKPPWSLSDLLQCFRKHWIAVFGSIIQRNLLSCVETLSNCLCSDKSLNRDRLLSAVRVAVELLSALSSRSPYSSQVTQAVSSLNALRHQLNTPKAPVEDTGDAQMVEADDGVPAPTRISHEEVWAMFQNIWTNVCQISSAVFSALGYPSETGLVTIPAPQDALNCLHRLSAVVKQLLEAFGRVLSVNSSIEDVQSLHTVILTSEIAAIEPQLTAKDLFECLSQQEYREKLSVGGAQLSVVNENLDRCVAAVRRQTGESAWP
ncbi:transcriptional protein SWT1 [Chanos chanos]|uniref:Transcriptional protein SWT1 n=1 Tax=Chanos chanos TaxID=29144 RepID=A0A6J2V393_CHACN|nr:transcriptional protein SWT1 [Chanos chanos]